MGPDEAAAEVEVFDTAAAQAPAVADDRDDDLVDDDDVEAPTVSGGPPAPAAGEQDS